jgi:Ca-activated chloride channel family protein
MHSLSVRWNKLLINFAISHRKGKNSLFLILLCIFTACAALVQPLMAGDTGVDTMYAAPRIYINSDEYDIDSLIPETATVQASISGVIADVRCTYKFVYKGTKPLDGALIVPAGKGITVHGIIVKAGNQIIRSDMREREQARDQYEKARRKLDPFFIRWQGYSGAVQMNISNIQPGTRIQAEIHYTELLSPLAGTYTFHLPRTHRPHYLRQLDVVPLYRDNYSDTSFAEPATYPQPQVQIQVQIAAGGQLAFLQAPGFRTEQNDKEYTLQWAGGNQDIAIHYRFAESSPATNLILFEEGREKFFLLAIHPPVEQPQEQAPPHEYIVLIDSSGWADASLFWQAFAPGLRSQDKLNIIQFGQGSRRLSATAQSCSTDFMAGIPAFLQGPVESIAEPVQLIDALNTIVSEPPAQGMATRSVLIISSGFVEANNDVLELTGTRLADANIFALAAGQQINQRFFASLSRLAMTDQFSLNGTDKNHEAQRFAAYVQKPALTHLRVGFDGFNAIALEPSSYPDLFAQRPVLIFGKYKGRAAGRIVITGLSGEKKFVQTLDLKDYKPQRSASGLPYLWARQRTSVLIDFNIYDRNQDRVNEITSLGFRYGLQTPYTSFAAAGTDINRKRNVYAVIQQSLNLNQGATVISGQGGQQLARTAVVEVEAACSSADGVEHEEEGVIGLNEIKSARQDADNPVLDAGKIEALRGQISTQIQGMQQCYTQALQKYRHMQGNVIFMLLTDDSGAMQISIADSELNIEEVDTCLLNALKQIKISAIPAGRLLLGFALEVF